MFSLFRPARRQSKLANTKSRLLWPLRCSYLVCQVCRWFTAPRPAQTRTRSLHHAAPPADNSSGFCACTLYLVFKEPTPTEPDSRSRWPSPVFSRPSLGEPSQVTTEELLCQYLAKLFYFAARSGTKKLLHPFGATIRLSLPGLAYRTSRTSLDYHNTRARGGLSAPTSLTRPQRILAEQA